MGAVAIIALVYTSALDGGALATVAGTVALPVAFNGRGVMRWWPYMPGFALPWWMMPRSGVHATVAGVLADSLLSAISGYLLLRFPPSKDSRCAASSLPVS